jgi:chaperonin cofactor prefoldin
MGLFWDLIQQSQISNQRDRAASLEARVSNLEGQLRDTQQLLHRLLERLERKFGEDIDQDGKIG